MARPPAHPIRKIMSFDQPMLDAVDRFRARERIGTEVEAVRKLIARGLQGTAESLRLPEDLHEIVDGWRLQHAPGLELEEVVGLLLRRGIARAAAADTRPIVIPSRMPAPATPAAASAPDTPGLTFDPETEGRIERFRKELINPPSREELLRRLIVVFEDGLESEVEDFRCEAMPEGTRHEAIQRLVELGLSDSSERGLPMIQR